MNNIDLSKPVKVHFIGIGGISMSGLADLLLSKGFSVSGSDSNKSALTEALVQKGAVVSYDQSVSSIPEGTQLVVYTAAISKENADLVDAKSRGIATVTRADLLGAVMEQYQTSIAISGTHGKTTTTSMVSEILLQAKADPTISIGGILPSIGSNFKIGGTDEYFVTEACEYTNSFFSFYPDIAIILNIDADHLDFFKDLDDIRNSFHTFAGQIKEDGLLIINGDIPDVYDFIDDIPCRVLVFGENPPSGYHAENITYDEKGCATFEAVVTLDSEELSRREFTLSVPGEHNVYNALAAIALADHLQFEDEDIAVALAGFANSKRRFEYKGQYKGINIYDDYAHHPTEIAATLSTAAKMPKNELWVIFQPHTYSRTKALLNEFADALSHADHVVLTDIYAARETDNLGISSQTLQELISKSGTDCHYCSSFDEAKNFVLQKCTNNDMLITMGAGNVVNIGEEILSQ